MYVHFQFLFVFLHINYDNASDMPHKVNNDQQFIQNHIYIVLNSFFTEAQFRYNINDCFRIWILFKLNHHKVQCEIFSMNFHSIRFNFYWLTAQTILLKRKIQIFILIFVKPKKKDQPVIKTQHIHKKYLIFFSFFIYYQNRYCFSLLRNRIERGK